MSKKRDYVLEHEVQIGGEEPAGLLADTSLSKQERDLLRHFEVEFDQDRTIARIYKTRSGRPVRSIINGRQIKPVGAFNMIKAGARSMPWESMRAELPFMELCEVATPVHTFLAQPHLLVMHVSGDTKFWRYFPDALLTVDRAFAEMVEQGTPFDEAVATYQPPGTAGELVNLVVEVKRDDDLRLGDPAYRAKLTIAAEVYRGLGWYFAEVVDRTGLEMAGIGYAVHEFALDHSTSISLADVECGCAIAGTPGATLGQLVAALGGSPIGLAKAAALHVRRVVMVDLRYDLADHSPIHLVADGKHNIGWLVGK